jgi:hypothetical protein
MGGYMTPINSPIRCTWDEALTIDDANASGRLPPATSEISHTTSLRLIRKRAPLPAPSDLPPEAILTELVHKIHNFIYMYYAIRFAEYLKITRLSGLQRNQVTWFLIQNYKPYFRVSSKRSAYEIAMSVHGRHKKTPIDSDIPVATCDSDVIVCIPRLLIPQYAYECLKENARDVSQEIKPI